MCLHCFEKQKSKRESTGCCNSNTAQNKENIEKNIILDGNNKLGLEGEEDEEEEEDRINNEYVQQDEEEDDEVSVTATHTFYRTSTL